VGLSVALIELDRSTPSIAALDFSAASATDLLAAIVGVAVSRVGDHVGTGAVLLRVHGR
jgi:hypothetical protein